MAIFEYAALTSSGRLMTGTIEAASRDQACDLLKDMQLSVNEIKQARREEPRTAIGRNEFILFNQQLAAIAKAGIPLERGLHELSADIASKPMRKLIDAVAADLEAGVPIEQAFEKRQKNFPPLYGRILKAGVETGRLSEMLTSLNRHLEIASQTRRIIFEAMAYPIVILALAAVIISAVFIVIVPQFRVILEEMTGGARLPVLTTGLFALSRHIVPFWTGIAFLVVIVLVIRAILTTFPEGRRFKEDLFMKIPVIGRLYHSSILSRMAEAMAMMVAAGADMPTCLRLAANAAGSEKLALESEMLARQIEQGANLLEAGQFCKIIPRLFLYSIVLGSQRNELQDNLYGLGQMYAQQARTNQARLQAILLPVMLVFVGGFIGMTVLALFLPMIQIITSLSGS
jgi:type II secretory pathway component PulF